MIDRMNGASTHGIFNSDSRVESFIETVLVTPTIESTVLFMSDVEDPDEEIQFLDVAPALEFACWTVVMLAPFLRLVNGPAVTDDQWWIQVSLFTGALIGAFSLRIYQVLVREKSR